MTKTTTAILLSLFLATTAGAPAEAVRALEAAGAEVLVLGPSPSGGVDLGELVGEILARIDRLGGLCAPHVVLGRIQAQAYDVAAYKCAADDLLLAAGVRGILANSRPNTGTHALYAARSDKLQVVPFLRPYRVRADVQTWFNDPQTMTLIDEEYRSPVVAQMVRFARERKLMLHAHSDVAALEILFSLYPEARIIWDTLTSTLVRPSM